jgi:gas vesicle protein
MANPNENQMRQTRDALLAMANNLRTLKKEKGDQLSDEEIKTIGQAITDTLDKASSANASAIQDTAENIQKCVCRIDDAKTGLNSAMKNINKVKNILNIATSVVKLASAVVTGNIQTILSAAGGVIDAAKA